MGAEHKMTLQNGLALLYLDPWAQMKTRFQSKEERNKQGIESRCLKDLMKLKGTWMEARGKLP